jgi:hypothetical protein
VPGRVPTWEQGVTDYLDKLDKKLDTFNAAAIANLAAHVATYGNEKVGFEQRITRLETQVKIYSGIAGAIGAAIGAAIMKLVVK